MVSEPKTKFLRNILQEGETVRLQNEDGSGLGLGIQGSAASGFFVENLLKTSAAGTSGKIKEGNQF